MKALFAFTRVILSTIILTGLLFSLIPPGVAFADQANPDSTPTMDAFIYRNLRETGDQLYLFYANIPYTATPDALATEAFTWIMYDTDNTTVLGQSIGTAFHSSGYGYNVYSMYFSAADAPTWNQEYIVRLAGNPAIFDTPPNYDYVLSTTDYSSLTVQSEVQAELALRIIVIATDLNIRWGLTTTSMVLAQETGTVLSVDPGETFFRGAIFGLQAMAPAAFQVSVGLITAEDREWDTTYTDNVSGMYAGTWVGTAQTAGGTVFGKDYDLLSIILLVVLVVGVIIGDLQFVDNVWAGAVDAVLIAVIFARIGVPAALLGFMGLVAVLCWIYISAKTWGVVR